VPPDDSIGLEMVAVPGSADVPLYSVKFDKDGLCTSPVTAAALVGALPAATHVFLLSHGWNNGWEEAQRLYHQWISNLLALRPATGQAAGPPRFRPVFAGIIWPSLVAPGEEGRGPQIAGGPVVDPTLEALIDQLGAALESSDSARLRELLGRESLSTAEAAEAARLVLPIFAAADAQQPEQPGARTATKDEDVLAEWRAAQKTVDLDDSSAAATGGAGSGEEPLMGGLVGDQPVNPAGPAVAGWLDKLNPVWLLRLGSVLVMKDRAGRIGATGVAELLGDLLGANPNPLPTVPRVHLVGHSYGCKVLLSALSLTRSPRPVDSVLLLQPALSARAFAADAGAGQPGGYRQALRRTRSAIVCTFSGRDVPLSAMYHLAARRADDLGEVAIAATVSKYAALGGYGPQQMEDGVVTWVQPVQPPDRYDTIGSGRIVAVDGGTEVDGRAVVKGHGDIGTPATAWMLASQLGR
jgi:hypothetical protein